MKLIPEIHFEDWDCYESEDLTVYIKGKLKIEVRTESVVLFIKSTTGDFFEVKEIGDSYWEIRSYDTFLNSDIVSDEDNAEYQFEMLSYIREEFSNVEYIIFNKNTKKIYSMCDLFDSEGGWNNSKIKTLWLNDEVDIINMFEDVDPLIYNNKGEWVELEMREPQPDYFKERNDILDKLIHK